ncbi:MULTISPECIES: apolipoprotein N-acyltransferase [Glaesserella]|uniref:Apolipoprotein N-acyltransferase n=1 Tax=Glaesserella australis TaxID=2094024 RepID=A0A328BVE8_9PAST|nr:MULTISPECIES: apolipoprotein N-acyltransferase [Glaesserella]AUI66074.1 apolipoprotein N-acyltransferase [Glaesserella sp. 15-184]RAL18206.1 apolipoprotein N-acyltransferase [Glaesserella australis]
MSIAKKSSNLTACLVAIISGGIGTLAYSPFDYWIVAFLSAAGLIWLATSTEKKQALWGSFLWAVSYFAVGVNWVQISMTQFGGVPEMVSYLAVLLLAGYLALYPLLFAYFIQRFRATSPWVWAVIFTFTEYLRGVVFTGFPWLQFGYSQIDSPFANLATIFGVEGLTFFVMVVSGYLVLILRGFANKSQHLTACSASLIVVLVLAFATKYLNFIAVDKDKAPVSVALVQGNIEQKMKWDPAHFNYTVSTYEQLIQSVLGKYQVIILPESAIPALEEQIEPLMQQLQRVGEQVGSEVIIGTLHQSQHGLFNSATVLGNKALPYSIAQSPRYNKHHLVPFGEYVPFGDLLDWMRDVFVLPINLSQGDFIQPALVAANYRFNMAICYEIIFTHQVQQNQQAQQADYLLTISNDAWFGASQGPWQHFQMARMRALELGKPLIRATNTGITAFVDAYGKVTAQAPQFEATTLTASVPIMKGQTLFAQFGNWLLYGICGIILLVAMALQRFRVTKK